MPRRVSHCRSTGPSATHLHFLCSHSTDPLNPPDVNLPIRDPLSREADAMKAAALEVRCLALA